MEANPLNNKIRPIAICVFRKDDRILVFEGYDPVKPELFYRPLGGGIEFGERGDQTVRREIREEIGAQITDVRYLGTLENIFTLNGRSRHEIVLVYDGRLTDPSLYDTTHLHGVEADGAPLKVVWKRLADFRGNHPQLYPLGLLELLAVS
jgi:8-oxo-dGTP pyrophosphatase MutT (NUDIX family)